MRKSTPPLFYADFSPRGNNTQSTIGDNGPFPHTLPLWRHSLRHSSTSLFFPKHNTVQIITRTPLADFRRFVTFGQVTQDAISCEGYECSSGENAPRALAACCPPVVTMRRICYRRIDFVVLRFFFGSSSRGRGSHNGAVCVLYVLGFVGPHNGLFLSMVPRRRVRMP